MPHVYREGRNFLFCSGPPCNIWMIFFSLLVSFSSSQTAYTIPYPSDRFLPYHLVQNLARRKPKKKKSLHRIQKTGGSLDYYALPFVLFKHQRRRFTYPPPFMHAYLTPFPTQTHCSSCMTPTLFIEYWFCFLLSSFILYFFFLF